MPPAKAELAGEAETKRAMQAFAKKAANLTATHTLIATRLIPGVRSRTPVLTGLLAGSYAPLGSPETAVVSSDVSYAGYIEHGTSRGVVGVHMVAATIAAEEDAIVKTYDEELARMAREEGWQVS